MFYIFIIFWLLDDRDFWLTILIFSIMTRYVCSRTFVAFFFIICWSKLMLPDITNAIPKFPLKCELVGFSVRYVSFRMRSLLSLRLSNRAPLFSIYCDVVGDFSTITEWDFFSAFILLFINWINLKMSELCLTHLIYISIFSHCSIFRTSAVSNNLTIIRTQITISIKRNCRYSGFA